MAFVKIRELLGIHRKLDNVVNTRPDQTPYDHQHFIREEVTKDGSGNITKRRKVFRDPGSTRIELDIVSADSADYGVISVVNVGLKQFTIAGDQSAIFTAGRKFVVSGSTGNDEIYTVVSAPSATPTVITVEETPSSATADGNIHINEVLAAGDLTSDFIAGLSFVIDGSTGNDGSYTVGTSYFDTTNTRIIPNQLLSDGADDGKIFCGELVFEKIFTVDGLTVTEYPWAQV